MHFLPLSSPLPTNLLLAKEAKKENWKETKKEYAYNYLSSPFYLILWGSSVEFSLLLTCKEDPAVRVHLFAVLWISLQRCCPTRHLSDFFPCRQSAFSAWHFLTARGMENKSPISTPHQNAKVFGIAKPKCMQQGTTSPVFHKTRRKKIMVYYSWSFALCFFLSTLLESLAKKSFKLSILKYINLTPTNRRKK